MILGSTPSPAGVIPDSFTVICFIAHWSLCVVSLMSSGCPTIHWRYYTWWIWRWAKFHRARNSLWTYWSRGNTSSELYWYLNSELRQGLCYKSTKVCFQRVSHVFCSPWAQALKGMKGLGHRAKSRLPDWFPQNNPEGIIAARWISS